MLPNVKEIIKEAEALDTAADALLDRLLVEIGDTVKEFDLGRIEIRAYTPYFNDGDPCEYHLEGLFAVSKKDIGEEDEDDDEDEDDWDDPESKSDKLREANPKLDKAMDALGKALYALEKKVEARYGTNIIVMIDKDGNVTTEDKEPNY